MIWGVALYLLLRVLAAAGLLAVADCMKEVSVYALLVLGLLEIGEWEGHAHRYGSVLATRP